MYSLLNVIAAAEGGAKPSLLDPNLLANITGIVVFLVALAVLRIYVWPKIVKGLDERNEKILSEIKSAEDAREQAKSALADYERELATAREEASQMINDARTQAKQLADELREKNEKELADRMARANADIEAAHRTFAYVADARQGARQHRVPFSAAMSTNIHGSLSGACAGGS